MRIAYLVFAYKNPVLVKRTIAALSSNDCAFLIHIDKKSDIADFSGIRGKDVFLTENRIPVYWAQFSAVRAIRMLIETALKFPGRLGLYDPSYHLALAFLRDLCLLRREFLLARFDGDGLLRQGVKELSSVGRL